MSNAAHERSTLCLWGFMGTGKSTVGAIVARAHAARFVDLDVAIEKRANKTIPAIFADEGEDAFRHLERTLLRETLEASAETRTVIALGGGALVDARSRRHALEWAFVVTLTAGISDILERTRASDRPLLREAPREAVERLLAQRAPAYADVHATLDTSERAPREVADRVLALWSPSPT